MAQARITPPPWQIPSKAHRVMAVYAIARRVDRRSDRVAACARHVDLLRGIIPRNLGAGDDDRAGELRQVERAIGCEARRTLS